jgi:hypothetical protein
MNLKDISILRSENHSVILYTFSEREIVIINVNIIDCFMILGDSSSSSDESYLQASTSRRTSNFTVSTHSAFQLNVPKPIAQRATTQNQVSTNSSRLNETDTNNLNNDNLNNESNRDNSQDNRNSRVTRSAQETTRSQEFNGRRG